MSKKHIVFIVAAVAAAGTLGTFLCACDGTPKNVSEVRRGYYSASDEVMTVTAVSGVREQNYVADGVAGELVPYTLVTVVPSTFDPDAVYTYTVSDGNASYGGTLAVHPFAASFSAEAAAELNGVLTVTVNDRTYELHSQADENAVGYEKAIDAANTELKPEGEYEVRARMIKNPIGEGLCWHVAYYFKDGKQGGVLLEPVELKVLARRAV